MADLIDSSTGLDAIAYVGDIPWHKKGQMLEAGADMETWRTHSGLDYTVQRAEVNCAPTDGGNPISFPDRHVLYRSDTRAPISVVSKYYNVVQPAEILDFFAELVKHNGFSMETAGALDGGKRVWALARVNDGAQILDTDLIRPYVLLATSYDASLSTTAKFTSVRVVCHNTLTMAAGHAGQGQSEKDLEGATVRIPHSAKFDATATRLDLGIVFDQWERFLATSRKLARVPVDKAFAHAMLKMLLPVPAPTTEGRRAPRPVEDSKAFRSIMTLFEGAGVGSSLTEANGTAWGLLNAVTEYVDHERGRDDTRQASAWFGAGEGLKNEAFAIIERATS